MNRSDRAMVREILHTIGVIGHTCAHELYRCSTVHRGGLTAREVEWLKARHEEQVDLLEAISMFRQRRL